MKTRLPYFLLLFVLFGCSKQQEPKEARFRIGYFLTTGQKTEVTLYQQTSEVYTNMSSFGKITNYSSLPAGKYIIRVKEGEQLIIEKMIGLGPGGKYTFCLTGNPLQHQKVNQQTINDKLHHIVEGSQGITPNGYLPQLLILNDFFSAGKGKSTIRFINLIPESTPFTAKLTQGEKQTNFKSLKYPRISDRKSLNPGKTQVEILYANSPQSIHTEEVDIKEDEMYTYFILPQDQKRFRNLELRSVINPKKPTIK